MRAIPGRDGLPLKYIISSNDLPDIKPNKDFLDDCINNVTLMGEAFTIDAADVDYIISKQVRIEVPVDGHTVRKYSFVIHTVDLALWGAIHFSIIKIIRYLDNSKSI